jgi:hypothetical protein
MMSKSEQSSVENKDKNVDITTVSTMAFSITAFSIRAFSPIVTLCKSDYAHSDTEH